MPKKLKKIYTTKKKRQLRIRKKLSGTPEKPRLSVFRSAKNMSIQIIDDVNQKTLMSFSTLSKDFQSKGKTSGNVAEATQLAEFYGPKIIEKGIKQISFDRSGYIYHGRIKALADTLRKAGLQF